MYLLTEWEGRTGKYLARGHVVGGLFGLARRPRTYQQRTVLEHMPECEVVERYRLSSGRINWLVGILQVVCY